MYVKHCKLRKNKQLELMKYFVAGTTTRTAADLSDVHRNTAIRFFHKLRAKIAHKQNERSEKFMEKSYWMKVILVAKEKENEVEVLAEKSQFLVF